MQVLHRSHFDDPFTPYSTGEWVTAPHTVVDTDQAQLISFVWYVVGITNCLLALRFVTLMSGFLPAGLTNFFITTTTPLVAPFSLLLGQPDISGGFVDTASVLAIVLYTLLGICTTGLIDLFYRSEARNEA